MLVVADRLRSRTRGAHGALWSRPLLGVAIPPEDSEELRIVFANRHSVRTNRGIHPGSSAAAVRRRYPTVSLHVGITGGLTSYLLVRHAGHALAFELTEPRHDRVSEIIAFRDSSTDAIKSEVCA